MTVKEVLPKTDLNMKNLILLICVFGLGGALAALIDQVLLGITFDNVPLSIIHKVMYMGWGVLLWSSLPDS